MAQNKKRFLTTIGITFWVLAIFFALLPNWPHIYYRLSPQTSTILAQTIAETVIDVPVPIPTPTPPTQPPPQITLPPVDPSLPEENGLIIEKVAIRGEIHEGEDFEEILKNGIWHTPNFGTPEDNTLPIILAAHRWGYLSWSNTFRKTNSFYNLPKMTINDQLTIIWNQREYTYQIYAEELNTKITDYQANLILYTCQLWNSPQRIIKYAKRVN